MSSDIKSVVLVLMLLLVPKARSETTATYGQQVVAAVLMAEAWGEGEEGMIAVAEVIRNRADRYEISPLAVVKQRRQFSSLNQSSPQALIRRYWKTNDWGLAIKIAKVLYNEPEKLPGITKGASHYDVGIPSWARGQKPVAIIGNHRFWCLYDEQDS